MVLQYYTNIIKYVATLYFYLPTAVGLVEFQRSAHLEAMQEQDHRDAVENSQV